MSIDNIIAQAVAKAVKELYNVEVEASSITPQTTKKEFENCISHIAFNDNKFDNNSEDSYLNINNMIKNNKIK